MRIASIIANNLISLREQSIEISSVADVIELRLDYLTTLDIPALAVLLQELSLPVLFTLREQSQGGHCKLAQAERLQLIWQLAALNPAYFDLELEVPLAFVKKFHAAFPAIQLIRSYHNFTQTPADLAQLVEQMQHPDFSFIKIAVFANDLTDTLRLLIFLRYINAKQARVIGIAMGEQGEISRILAPLVGSPFTYGSVSATTSAAPGQLSLAELTDIYRLPHLNSETKIYALLGAPVNHSQGHIWHNQKFSQHQQNAVYVKLNVAQDKLATVITQLQALPFYGFSVTMPYKETIVPYLDVLKAEAAVIKVVNTIRCVDHQLQGYNTDGAAAIDSLKPLVNLENTKVLILGAGGSAKAIAYALHQQGAKITLCNRTLARVRDFAVKFKLEYLSFSALLSQSPLDYAVIINTLPAPAFAEYCAELKPTHFIKTVVPVIALDIVYQATPTAFMCLAHAAHWHCIKGDVLFDYQAKRQRQIWFGT